MSEATLSFESQDLVRTLFGERDRHLRKVRDSVGIDVVIRGDELHLYGTDAQIERGRSIFSELQLLIEKQGLLRDVEVARVIETHVGGNGNGHAAKLKPAAEIGGISGGIELFEKEAQFKSLEWRRETLRRIRYATTPFKKQKILGLTAQVILDDIRKGVTKGSGAPQVLHPGPDAIGH